MLRELNPETKTKVINPPVKVPALRTNPNINRAPTTPKSPTHPSHECDGRVRDPDAMSALLTPMTTARSAKVVYFAKEVSFCEGRGFFFFLQQEKNSMEKSEEEATARHLSHDLLISSIIVVDDGLDVAAIVKSICPDSGACVCLW
jgi:hypothetical protein